MTKYFKGAEDRPLKAPNTECQIIVYLRDLSSNEEDDVVQEWKLDYANYYDRKKLGRITFWAVMNSHLVETVAVKDVDLPEVKS